MTFAAAKLATTKQDNGQAWPDHAGEVERFRMCMRLGPDAGRQFLSSEDPVKPDQDAVDTAETVQGVKPFSFVDFLAHFYRVSGASD